jgi:RNA-binding protein
MREISATLDRHELIKVRFIDCKEKSAKEHLSTFIESESQSRFIGTMGHTALFYRQNNDPEKRKIAIPIGP